MDHEQVSLRLRLTQTSLIAAVGLAIFSFGGVLISLIISWLLKISGLTVLILNQNSLLVLGIVGALVFAWMTFCVFAADYWVQKKIESLSGKLNLKVLLPVTFLVLLAVFMISYLGVSVYLVFLRQAFWS
jgi:hypothetical protein